MHVPRPSTLAAPLLLTALAAANAAWDTHRYRGTHLAQLGGETTVSVAKAAVGVCEVLFAAIYLPVCRGLITWLRSTWLRRVLDFDGAINVHQWIAGVGVVAALVHSVAAGLAVAHAAAQPPDIKVANGMAADATLAGLFSSRTMITGYLLIAIMVFAIPFSIPWRRRASFTSFWLTHHLLIIVFPVILIMHSVALPSRALDLAAPIKPTGYHQSRKISHMIIFMAVPLAIYAVERACRTVRASRASRVLVATRQGHDVVEVRLAKPAGWRHAPGQYVHVCVPALSPYEWHPFTIASAPDDGFIGLVVRRAGDWTAALHTALCGDVPQVGKLPAAAPQASLPAAAPTRPSLRVALSAVLSRRGSRADSANALEPASSVAATKAATTKQPSASNMQAPPVALRPGGVLQPALKPLDPPLRNRHSAPAAVAAALVRRATCQPWDEDVLEQDEEAAAEATVRAAATAADAAERGSGAANAAIRGGAVTDTAVGTASCAALPPARLAGPFAGPPLSSTGLSTSMRVCIDGPWGAPTQNVCDYDVALLIGAGVGATPMAAVLRATAHELLNARCATCGTINERALRMRQHKIHFVWVARRLAGTEWLASLLAGLAAADDGDRFDLALHVTRDTADAVAAAAAMTGHSGGGFHVEHGRPDWRALLARVVDEARDTPGVSRVGIFVCGPRALTAQVRRECSRINAARRTVSGPKLSFFHEYF